MKAFAALGVFVVLGLSLTAQAEAGARAWVSSTGTDSGTCLVAVPCRTFQYAHDHTDAGGEIDVKDPGGYGPLTITKSISVVADGVLATIGGTTTISSVAVKAGSSDRVMLKGLTINNFAPDVDGILIQGGANVVIDHCLIQGGYAAILVDTPQTFVIVNDSILYGSGLGVGQAASSSKSITLSGNLITDNSTGVYTFGQAVYSTGDNRIYDNKQQDVSGSITKITMN